jgi:hypothetical protein
MTNTNKFGVIFITEDGGFKFVPTNKVLWWKTTATNAKII